VTPTRRTNLQRLLAPRHIAFVGGDSAVFAARQCAAGHFKGEIWGLNPQPNRFGAIPSYTSVEALPEAPDAVFLAVPRQGVPGVVCELREKGAGGIVCYSAGFGELGDDGVDLERELVTACGEMALAGPNVFGLLNYITGAHLWPFSHGGKPVERGPAILSQSGMLSGYLLTNRRSVHFSYVIGAGNQSVLGVEDYLDYLADDPAVTGFGLYIETLRDIPRFAEAVGRALDRGVPVVALKAGRSTLAAQTALTHTGSLAGEDALYQSLFDRIGVARVPSPSLLLETLQMLTTAGAPSGPRLAAFTCSGGDVAMLADCAEQEGLVFDPPDQATERNLRQWLPQIATVGNPLDYTTPLWGQEETLEKVFAAALAPGYDAALLVQDYPPLDLGEDRPYYQADARAFMRAAANASIPAAVCSSLPENLDPDTQATLIENGVAPLQGIGEATAAIRAAAVFGKALGNRQRGGDHFIPSCHPVERSESALLDEWHGKQLLAARQIRIPQGELCSTRDAAESARRIGFPVALKLVSSALPHKSEHGIVRLNLGETDDIGAVAQDVLALGSKALGRPVEDRILIEQMADGLIAELLIGVQNDPQFGLVMTIAGGGTLVELMSDAATVLLPAEPADLVEALSSLRVMSLLQGYRGRAEADLDELVDVLMKVNTMALELAHTLIEMDINPLSVSEHGCMAVDALIRVGDRNAVPTAGN
jgi:acyl-CoA synthetase (NDP forming)|tara:strand:+ start:397 stop:2520 length:2124 start_codon:yes stop_codon:yes gene_type:complete